MLGRDCLFFFDNCLRHSLFLYLYQNACNIRQQAQESDQLSERTKSLHILYYTKPDAGLIVHVPKLIVIDSRYVISWARCYFDLACNEEHTEYHKNAEDKRSKEPYANDAEVGLDDSCGDSVGVGFPHCAAPLQNSAN